MQCPPMPDTSHTVRGGLALHGHYYVRWQAWRGGDLVRPIRYIFTNDGLSWCGWHWMGRRVLLTFPPWTASASNIYWGSEAGDCQSVSSQGGALGMPRWSGNGYYRVGQAQLCGCAIHGSWGVKVVRTLDSSGWCHSLSSCLQLVCTSDEASFQVYVSPSWCPRSPYYCCSKGDLQALLFHRGWQCCAF